MQGNALFLATEASKPKATPSRLRVTGGSEVVRQGRSLGRSVNVTRLAAAFGGRIASGTLRLCGGGSSGVCVLLGAVLPQSHSIRRKFGGERGGCDGEIERDLWLARGCIAPIFRDQGGGGRGSSRFFS